MPFNLLLLPLLGGYIFITHWNKTKFEALRAEGYHLLFKSALSGAAFLWLSYSLAVLTEHVWGPNLWWAKFVPFGYSGITFLSLLIGTLLWKPLNRFSDEISAIDQTIRDKDDPLELTLWESLWPPQTLLISLRNRKVYVGWVIENFNPAYERQSVAIVPAISGYRDKDNLTTTFTTDYMSVYEEFNRLLESKSALSDKYEDNEMSEAQIDEALKRLDPDNFKVSISVGEIISVGRFDPEVYRNYFTVKQEEAGEISQ